MYNNTIAYIALSPVFAIALSSASLSFATDATFTSQSQNMKGLMLAYADLAETNKSGGAKSGGGGYGLSLMDKNKDNKVSKEEFLKYNEAIFDKVDTNRDGSVDKNEADSYVSKSEPKTSPNYSTSHGEIKK
jgi:lipopolysaccharide export LptBFGC system permease protein LptF